MANKEIGQCECEETIEAKQAVDFIREPKRHLLCHRLLQCNPRQNLSDPQARSIQGLFDIPVDCEVRANEKKITK